MHKQRYNSLRLDLSLSPRGPLLIKSGAASVDPSLPDMQFVRTVHPDGNGVGQEMLYIPGASMKGVVRSFIEKALRTLDDRKSWKWACATFGEDSCSDLLQKEENPAQVYAHSCGACRVFGNMRLRGRAAFSDFYPSAEVRTETRYGVAISRLSHAVAQGPFEMEVAVEGTFKGQLVLENYELWQLGLLAAAINALNEGLLQVGFGKNRGFGEVYITVNEAVIDEIFPLASSDQLRGMATFAQNKTVDGGKTFAEAYGLAGETPLVVTVPPFKEEQSGFYQRRWYNTAGWQAIGQAAANALR